MPQTKRAIVLGALCDSIEVDALEVSEGFKWVDGQKFFFVCHDKPEEFGPPPGILFLLNSDLRSDNSYTILQMWKAAGLKLPSKWKF